MQPSEERIAQVRDFNRFYTRHIGVLNEGLLNSRYSLTEVRVMFELRYRERPTAAALAAALSLDPAYLSRILKKLKAEGFVDAAPDADDRRQQRLVLTETGLREFAGLDRASHDEVREVLEPLSAPQQRRLVGAMGDVRRLLGDAPARPAPILIRSHRPGDIGWIVHRHGALYWQEFGWDETFEALVAEIAGQFLKDHDPKREHCWVAEQADEIVASVFLVRSTDAIAKLRLLYVEPSARGQGLGQAMVEQCIRFATDAGYSTLTLWTNDVLVAARRIYEATGFELVQEEPHHSFGHDLVGQTWSLAL